MPKVRLALLGMLAVYAVSLAASAAASAATQGFWDCQKVGTSTGRWNNSHCTERGGTEEWATKGLTGTETKGVEGTSGESKLETKLGGKKVVIICQKDIVKGILKANGASEGEATFFKECKIYEIVGAERKEISTCTIHEPITVRFTDQLIHNANGEIEDEFKPTQSEEVFTEITIEGNLCALKATIKVKGSQVCELPNAMQSLVTHQVVCTPSGSKLKIGAEEAFFTSNEHINVTGGPQWGAA